MYLKCEEMYLKREEMYLKRHKTGNSTFRCLFLGYQMNCKNDHAHLLVSIIRISNKWVKGYQISQLTSINHYNEIWGRFVLSTHIQEENAKCRSGFLIYYIIEVPKGGKIKITHITLYFLCSLLSKMPICLFSIILTRLNSTSIGHTHILLFRSPTSPPRVTSSLVPIPSGPSQCLYTISLFQNNSYEPVYALGCILT